MPDDIAFDRAKVLKLAECYMEAVVHKQDQFLFEGRPMLTRYAKYLIEYLESLVAEGTL